MAADVKPRALYLLPERFRDLLPLRVPVEEADPSTRARSDAPILVAYDALEAMFEAQRCLYCHDPPCMRACPLGQDCREYNLEISRGNFEAAKAIILRDNPLASTLCHVCYHYCEEDCVIGVRGEPVAIRHLKRAALELGGGESMYERAASKGQAVGIVGGGPAGLMAAWWLAQRGYDVTVYEGSHLLGGLATMTIPRYRLPRQEFERDLARMWNLGIRFRMNAALGRDFTLAQLRASHDAVILAIGTHAPKTAKLLGSELPGVHSALGFLKGMFLGAPPAVGARVAVIGGGDVAMDCARMALRRGAREVTVLYRRSRQEMPASAEEIRQAEDEGVVFRYLTAPLRVVGAGRVEGIECQAMALGEPDPSGRRRPVPIEGSNVVLPVDTIVLALGQTADLAGLGLEALGIQIDGDGVAVGVEGSPCTKEPGVYVAGGNSVVYAMKAGRAAAQAADAFLTAGAASS